MLDSTIDTTQDTTALNTSTNSAISKLHKRLINRSFCRRKHEKAAFLEFISKTGTGADGKSYESSFKMTCQRCKLDDTHGFQFIDWQAPVFEGRYPDRMYEFALEEAKNSIPSLSIFK